MPRGSLQAGQHRQAVAARQGRYFGLFTACHISLVEALGGMMGQGLGIAGQQHLDEA